MMQNYDLQRFIEAHQRKFDIALNEITNGKKQSHWMWYIFPQIKGLGWSQMSQYYAIQDMDEAVAFLQEPYLSSNLYKICNALLSLETSDIKDILNVSDDKKLCSSMTLFEIASVGNPIFKAVLDKFYGGIRDQKTLKLLKLKET